MHRCSLTKKYQVVLGRRDEFWIPETQGLGVTLFLQIDALTLALRFCGGIEEGAVGVADLERGK